MSKPRSLTGIVRWTEAMELVERYLHAVKWWLPNAQKQDIVAELSEEIRSQIEDREAELGRPLNNLEVESILKGWGSPILVAERYLPQQHLIGPALFPIYRLVLKMAALYYLVPASLVWLALILFNPNPAAHPSFGNAIGGIWSGAVNLFAFLTVGFAILERCQPKLKFLEEWNPR